jgi:hypothetical protein
MWYSSVGVLRYGPGRRLVVEVDQGIADFYRALIPKWMPTQPQRYGAHVSVVRKETPLQTEHWGRYDGHETVFEYSNQIEQNEVFFWLPVQCRRLMDIRVELGLPAHPWWVNQFHVTIGNRREEHGQRLSQRAA